MSTLMKQFGDPIEKAIATDDSEMEEIILVYESIWAKFILCRRDKSGAFLKDIVWENFGARHYTALIRFHHARDSKSEIQGAVAAIKENPSAGGSVLKIHRAMASFWENLGATIDNLTHAAGLVPGAPCKEPRNSAMEFAYDRRTQLIHDRVVPVNVDEGAAEFLFGMFDDKGRSWRDSASDGLEWVDEFHEKKWIEVKTSIYGYWKNLERHMLARAERCDQTADEGSTPDYPSAPSICSGVYTHANPYPFQP